MNKKRYRRIFMGFYLFLLIASSHFSFSQKESSGKVYHFNGNVSLSNNGFSFIQIPIFIWRYAGTFFNRKAEMLWIFET
jgi:hypothetical protein